MQAGDRFLRTDVPCSTWSDEALEGGTIGYGYWPPRSHCMSVFAASLPVAHCASCPRAVDILSDGKSTNAMHIEAVLLLAVQKLTGVLRCCRGVCASKEAWRT